MRDKRGSLVINLIETPNGFSLVEGTDLLNRPSLSIEKQAQTAQTSSILNAMNMSSSPIPTQPKQQKSLHQKITLIFPSNTANVLGDHPHPLQINQLSFKQTTNKVSQNIESKKSIQWFSLNAIHENEINEIKLWYAEEHPEESLSEVQKSKDFQRYLLTYKKHRNMIVNLYYNEYFPTKSYLPASEIRKRIPYDAYWLMKIHSYLSNNFIINSNNTTVENNNFSAFNEYLFKFNPDQGKYSMLEHEFDLNIETQTESNKKDETQRDIETLKLITNKIRPFCDYCGIHCGIVWFRHFKQIDPKQIATIMKNVNSKNPPLSQKPYEMTLCTRCYCDGNFPLLLTHHDFKKTTVNDKLQPNKKKKLRKKKKDRKRKRRERLRLKERKQQGLEQEEQEEDEMIYEQAEEEKEQEMMEEHDQHAMIAEQKEQKVNNIKTNNDQDKSKVGQKQQPSNPKIQQSNQVKNDSILEQQLQDGSMKKDKNVNNNKNQQQILIAENAVSLTEEQNVGSLIDNILNHLQKRKTWTPEETLRLLQLVDEKKQNWHQILDQLNNEGMCTESTVQDVIRYFVSLPRRGITKLKQEYEPQQFLLENYTTNRNTVADSIAERTLNKAIQISIKADNLCGKQDSLIENTIKQNKQKSNSIEQDEWKLLLNEMVEIQKQRMLNRISILEQKQSLSMQVMRRLTKIKY